MTTVVESSDSQWRTPVTRGSTVRPASSAETGAGKSMVVGLGALCAGAGGSVRTLTDGAADADAMVLLCSLHQIPRPWKIAIATIATILRNPGMFVAGVTGRRISS